MTSWIIGLLILLNISTLGTLWFQQFRQPPKPPISQDKRSETIQRFLQQELDLTDEQVQQFTMLRTQYLRTSQSLMNEVHDLRKTLTDELFATSPDVEKANRIAEEIGAKHAELERLLFTHFMELKAVCQPAQQAKFQVLIRELLNMLKPPEQPGPPEKGQLGAGMRNDQQTGNSSEMPPPPREAVAACERKQSGEACEFVTLSDEKKNGNCQRFRNLLACVPEGNPPPWGLPPEN